MNNLSLEECGKELVKRKSALQQEEQERERRSPAIYRIDVFIREGRKSQFDATLVSLGLFGSQRENHSHFLTEITKSLKSDVVIKFMADVGVEVEDWKYMSAEIVANPLGMKRLYDGHWHLHLSQESIQSTLAMDAIFLTGLLLYFFHSSSSVCPQTQKIFSRHTFKTLNVLISDAIKLENQIPLELVRKVISIIMVRSSHRGLSKESCSIEANEMLTRICSEFVDFLSVEFPSFHLKTLVDVNECEHLLHYFAEAFWKGTKTTSSTINSTEAFVPPSLWSPQVLASANKLCEHGIEFQGQKGFRPKFKKYAFRPWKATLFLPTIKYIDVDNEGSWRNLLAFEDRYMGERCNRKPFISYLQFMDLLINTKEDVSVLSTGKNPVIQSNCLGDDEAVASLFNSMTKHYSYEYSEEWSSLQDELNEYVNSRFRTFWSALVENFSHKPWLPFSVIAALALLILTFIQTIYTMKSYGSD